MSEPTLPEPVPPSPEPTDLDRRAMIDRIQQALAEDQLDFAELDHRFAIVYAANTRAELEQAAAGLPELRQPPPPVAARHLAPTSSFSLFGDVKIGGWIAVDGNIDVSSVFGSIVLDLSSAVLPTGGVTVISRTVFGDVKVVVPDGVRVQTQVRSVFGSRTETVTPALDGAPVVRIHSSTVFGSTSVYSLSMMPVGALRRLWIALRGRPT